jgi:hypothetical protein
MRSDRQTDWLWAQHRLARPTRAALERQSSKHAAHRLEKRAPRRPYYAYAGYRRPYYGYGGYYHPYYAYAGYHRPYYAYAGYRRPHYGYGGYRYRRYGYY